MNKVDDLINQGKIILLFGLPRSGTTWIGKIFDSNPNTLYLHEPDTYCRFQGIKPLIQSKDPEISNSLLNAVKKMLHEVLENRPSRVFCKAPVFPKNYLNRAQYYSLLFSTFSSKLLQALNITIPVYNIPKSINKNTHIVWKSINSAGLLGAIQNSISCSNGVLILRHPAGHIASVLDGISKNKHTSKVPATDDLNFLNLLLDSKSSEKFDLTTESFVHMTGLQRLAWRWVLMYEHALDNLGDNHYIAKYEDICENPLEKTTEMFEHLGLKVGSQVKRFLLDSSSGSSSKSYYSLKKSPLASAYSWCEKLSASQIEEIQKILVKSKRLCEYYPPSYFDLQNLHQLAAGSHNALK